MKERPDLEDVKANAKEVDAHGQPSGEQLALTCKGPSRVDSEGPREAVHNLSVSSRPTSEAAIAPLPSEESVAKKKECRGLAGPVGRYIGNEHMAQDGHERELVCDGGPICVFDGFVVGSYATWEQVQKRGEEGRKGAPVCSASCLKAVAAGRSFGGEEAGQSKSQG